MNLAPFVATPFQVARQMLTLADLKPREILYDLGSGDGRVVIIAAQEFSAYSVGIEIREDLVKRALIKISELNLENQVKIVNEDFFKVSVELADVISLYLTTSANEKIRPKLEKELKHGVRIVSHDYQIPGWKPTKIDNFSENERHGFPKHTIYLYKR